MAQDQKIIGLGLPFSHFSIDFVSTLPPHHHKLQQKVKHTVEGEQVKTGSLDFDKHKILWQGILEPIKKEMAEAGNPGIPRHILLGMIMY